MALRLNKFVKISNPRLECLYLFFCICLATFLATKFVLGQEHLAFYDVEHSIRFVSTEPQVVGGHADLQRIYDGQADMCAQLDGRCLPPCQSSDDWTEPVDSGFSCAFPEHLAFPLNGHSVMFPTSITTQSLMAGNATTAYYPYEEAVGLRIRIGDGPSRTSSTGTSDLRSVFFALLDHTSSIYRVIDDPSDAIDLSLLAMLEMSGLGRGYLDAKLAVEDDLLTGRDRGARLRLVAECYDRPSAWGQQRSDVYKTFRRSGANILCTVRAVVAEETSSVVSGPFIAHVRHSIHGVTVGVAPGRHRMSQFSTLHVLDVLVQVAVYARIPKFLALMVTVYLLGHLSRIYKAVIYEEFDIAEQIAGTAARLTSNTVTFEELCGHEQFFVSKEGLLRRIKKANPQLAHLAADELGHFVDFSHEALLDLNKYTELDHLFAEVKTDAKRLFRMETVHPHYWCSWLRSLYILRHNSAREVRRATEVGVYEFTRGCSSNDKLHIMDAMHLFSRNRTVKWLEHLFMPAYIRRLHATISMVDRIKNSVELKRADATAAAGAPPVNLHGTFDGLVSDPEHTNHGSKAYNKILDLEVRYQSLEDVAKDFVLSDHLSGHLQSQAEIFERSMKELHQRHNELEELLKAQILRADAGDSLVKTLGDEQADGGKASCDMVDDSETPSGPPAGPPRRALVWEAEAVAGTHPSCALPVLEPADDSARRAAFRALFLTSTTPLAAPIRMPRAALSTPDPESQADKQDPWNRASTEVALQRRHAMIQAHDGILPTDG